MSRDQAKYWAESNLQCSIVSFLRKALPASYRVVSVPNGRFQADPRTIARLKREGLTPGVFDLLILAKNGTFASLEVKAEAGRLSVDQQEWGNWLSEGGASAAVVRSLEEAIAALESFGVPLRARVAA
jgi:hypothetical protein